MSATAADASTYLPPITAAHSAQAPAPGLQRAPGSPPLPGTPLRFVLHFVFGRYRWWLVAMVLCETANATCGILIPYALNHIITEVTSSLGAGSRDVDAVAQAIQWPLTLFIAFTSGELFFGRLTSGIQFRCGPRLRQEVARNLYHYLQFHSHRYFSETFAGALAHRISEAAQGVTQTLWTLITEFWPIAIVIGVANGLLLAANVWLGGFLAVWSAIFIVLSFLLARRCQPYALAAASARSETTGHIVDSVTNLSAARLFARLGYEREQLDRTQAKELALVLRSNRYMERVRWFQFGSAAILKIGMVLVAFQLWRTGGITVGQFVMAVSLSLLIIAEVRNLSRRFLEFFEFIGNISNGVRTIVRPHELVDRPQARTDPFPHAGIAFDSVTFRYGDGSTVFDSLNVVIPAGQRVGLVGLSGSGKTTFVSLLLRLYDPQSGSIRIGDVDVRDLTQDALHEQIGLIPQDPTLFHRSLRDNIRYGRITADDAEIDAAAQRSHAHEFIVQTPGGYQAMVGERGIKLSGGQRQRIAIARVVLKGAPVLILDEATSSLDSITERAIQDALDREMIGKTVIVVAHRLSTIVHLDRILVFDQGRIVEDGSHAALLAKRGSYHRLWSMQSYGFLPEGGDQPPPSAGDPADADRALSGTADDGDQSTEGRRRDDDSRDSPVLMA